MKLFLLVGLFDARKHFLHEILRSELTLRSQHCFY